MSEIGSLNTLLVKFPSSYLKKYFHHNAILHFLFDALFFASAVASLCAMSAIPFLSTSS